MTGPLDGADGRDWQAIASAAPATVLLSGTTVLWASAEAGNLVLADPSALVGRDVLSLLVGVDRPRARHALAEALRRPGDRLGPLRVRPLARPSLRLEVSARAQAGDHLVVVAWDVSARVRTERDLGHRAGHDALTGLPGRALLADRWARSRERVRTDPGLRTFVLLCHLDGLGATGAAQTGDAQTGDAQVVEVARRLTAEVRPGDTVARLGGEAFVVLVDAVPLAHVEALARRLRRRVGRSGEGGRGRLSVGWAADDPSRSTQEVLARADARRQQDGHAHRTDGQPAGEPAGQDL